MPDRPAPEPPEPWLSEIGSKAPPDAFHAIAHPARRAIIEYLADGPDESGRIADAVFLRLGLRWSSTSKHLRVLQEAGIVECEPYDTYRVHELRAGGLDEVRRWVERYTAPASRSRPDFWFTKRRERGIFDR